MKNVFITGVSGFAGTSLVHALHQVDDITLYGHSRNLNKTKAKFENYNIQIVPERSSEVFNTLSIDCIIHLAGIAHDVSNRYKPEDYYIVNFEDTRSLYHEFSVSNVNTFIFLSSVKAVIDSPSDTVKENLKKEPTSHYGLSKSRAEDFIQESGHSEGKQCYILRPCMMHGPGNKGNLNLLYTFVKSGIPYPLGAFKNNRSFLSADNFNFIIRQLISTNIDSGVYNLADDESMSTVEIVKIISGALNRKPRILSIAPGLLKSMARIGDILKLPLNSSRLNKLTESYIVSNEKIKKALQISNFPVSAREGLERTIQSFKLE